MSVAGDKSDSDRSRFSRFVGGVELVDIRFPVFHGRLIRADTRELDSLRINLVRGHQIRNRAFEIRYSVTAIVISRGDPVAELELAVLLSFLSRRDDELVDDDVEIFMEQEAWFMAYPYVREGLQSIMLRLGLEPVIIGLISPDNPTPTDAYVPDKQSEGDPSDQL